MQTPLYEARVDPDITFFGFDLTVSRARGASGEHPNDEAGWFFVIKERPGEPRFGFDARSATGRPRSNDRFGLILTATGGFEAEGGGGGRTGPRQRPVGGETSRIASISQWS